MKTNTTYILLLAICLSVSCNRNTGDENSTNESTDKQPQVKFTKVNEVSESNLLADDELLEHCDKILDSLVNDGVAASFQHIRKLSPLKHEELSNLERLTEKQLEKIRPRYGKLIGYERVSCRQIGDSVTECVYIAKCERHILRWRFYFYRPKDKWFLNTFNWDDKISEL